MKCITYTSDFLRQLARRLLVTCLFFSVPGFSQAQQDLTSGRIVANASTTTHTGGEATRVSNTAAANEPHDDAFLIGSDDVLGINVWKEAEVSRTETVRSDGKISLPLLGELQAAGKTPKQLQDEIHDKLAAYISDPEVTVIVQENRSHRFNVLGQVQHPGTYPLTTSTTVLDAIALAGGFRDFAKQRKIYVLRSNADGTKTQLEFNYKKVIKGNNPEQNVKLSSRDTLVVP